MEILFDSLYSFLRFFKFIIREERERKVLEEKDKREVKQREKGGRFTGIKYIKTELRGVKDSLKLKGVKIKSVKDSFRLKRRKCDDKVQIEDDIFIDLIRFVCFISVKGYGMYNNFNIEKLLDIVFEQGVENYNCVQNITEIKIKNVVEDLVFVRFLETESFYYVEDKFVNLSINIDVDISGLKVMLFYVEFSFNFYVYFVFEVFVKIIDYMYISLNKIMEEILKKQLQKMSKLYKLLVGDLCCVLFFYDNQYYRGFVMGFELVLFIKGFGSKDFSLENVGKVLVFYLDFGNYEVVFKRRVFFLFFQYVDFLGLVLYVCLVYIQFSVVRGFFKKEVKWIDMVIEKFIFLIGFDFVMSMIIVDGDI